MDAAAERVQLIAREVPDGEDADCARSILQTPVTWTLWERELGTALRPVANCRTREQQIRELRRTSFAWIHRAAPFRHLRTHRVRGEQRKRLVRALHGPFAHYDLAMIAEHERYLRSVCHGFCSVHLGGLLLEDRLHGESMQRYQWLYMEYFQTFAGLICGGEGSTSAEAQALLPLMKRQLAEVRAAILDYPHSMAWLRREAALRMPHGDTQIIGRVDLNLR